MAQGIVYTDGTYNVNANFSAAAASTYTGGTTALKYADVTTETDWTAITELKGITQNAGTSAQIDLTHFGSTTRERRAGLGDPGSFQFTCNVVFAASGSQVTIYGLWESGAVHFWQIKLPMIQVDTSTYGGATIGFSGSVDSANFSISGTDEPGEFTFSVLVDEWIGVTGETIT